MGDFLTLEEAAERLGVSVSTLRHWIRRGRARASRRGGAYVLRDREVERLSKERPADEPEGDEGPEPVRVMPPRSRSEESESSLEAQLLARMQERLERLEQAQSGGANDELARLRALVAERDSQIEELGAALATRHEELKKAEGETRRLRERITGGSEESDSLRTRLEGVERENEALTAENNQLVRDTARLTRREEELSRQLAEAEGVRRERDQLVETVRQMEVRLAQAARQAQWEASARRTIEELEYECDELRHQLEEQRMALQLHEARGSQAHHALHDETVSLRQELAAAFEAARRAKEIRTDLEDEVARLNEQLTRAHGRIGGLEREVQTSSDRLEEREQFLEAENRRLKDHLNTLQYKLEMAGEGGASGVAESRELLERITLLEEQMLEKDRLLQEDSREKMSLRERVETLQRELYEIQARYDKEKSEWSALLAREIQNRDRLIQQSYDPTPRTQGGGGGGWGLFRPKNDAR